MKTKFLAIFVILALVFAGCSDDDNNNPADANDDNTTGTGTSSIVISGCENGTYNNVETGVLLTSDGVTIAVSGDEDSGVSALMGSTKTTAGTYTIPNDFNATFMNEKTMKMYDLYEGTVNITTLTQTKVQGTLTGKAYQTDMSTFITDSSKILNITINFSTE